ncbi:sodium-potassium ATPase [Dichomitus squalens LYAD-421 SS1]|uniref:Sodium-potassium ATPase n=2 Tax=Dichomitus squalens TaxID=114155 RepID=A0A4Q9MT12_9APHY|nr:sodium-potassium ATPase [Dichomitus squalens LYAD-421 SS1]EJF58252.1 sodium-potassium ATPase [Dichomitus squalens LYAD-421 SS1]TBU30278.1 sodium-potassium ATPase [Dichomitus squalens]
MSLPTSTSFDLEAQPEEKATHFVRHVTVEHEDHDHPPASADATAEVAPRLTSEFRTLSIHVENRASPTEGDAGVSGAIRNKAVKDLVSLDWHTISVDEALQRLSVSPQSGLDNSQVKRRREAWGKNVISPPKNNMLRKVLEWIFGGFGSLLFVASIFCFISWKPLGEPDPQIANLALGVVLLIVLFFQGAFNAWQDFSTSRVMSSIKDMLPSDVLILRDGNKVKLPASELVNGDLVYIGLGEKVPADLRLIQVSWDLRFDRSIITGESEPIAGRVDATSENFLETKNIALQGTHCVSGSGTGLVVQSGDSTIFGRIAKLSSMEPSRMTTLQREVLFVVLLIASLATTIAVLIVILWAAWLRRSFPSYINVSGLLIDIVSVMVAFLPDGLPLAVTLSIAKIAHTLSQHKVLCKSLVIVETLGAVNVLCSDKTGTLTQNKMQVVNVAVEGTGFEAETFGDALSSAAPEVAFNLSQVVAVGALCNTAVFGAESKSESARPIMGNETDVAVLRFSEGAMSVDALRGQWQEVFKVNFNSKNKYMLKLLETTLPNPPTPIAPWDHFAPADSLLVVKGAPEVLLPRCKYALDPKGGEPIPLSPPVLERLTRVQEQWARDGQRVLLLARRVVRADEIPKSADPLSEEFGELVETLRDNLIVVGLVGLVDPLKPGIADVVKTCREAGIRFFIVTGDHPTTSVAIAARAGIITNVGGMHGFADLPKEGRVSSLGSDEKANVDVDIGVDGAVDVTNQGIVITGPELDQLDAAQVDQLCKYQEIVFARTTPEQKLRIVNEFKRRECIVAMTGDGVNDAPSLKAADCGIAMGDGSDVAREAADMVLLDDFSAIIVALTYGRLVFDNLKKSVLYLIPAGSFSELVPILSNVLIGVPQLLSNIQMILICVATDVLPALSLCLEKPETDILKRPPRNVKTEHLVDWRLLLQAYGFLGILEALCAMSMSFWYLHRNGVPFSNLILGFGNWPGLTDELLFRAQSVNFFTLIMMQWGNLFATRGRKLSITQHTPMSNPWVFAGAAAALCIGIFFHYVPWFHGVFQTRPVPVEFFFIPLTFGLGLLVLDEVRKLIVRRYPKSLLARIAW